MSALFFFMWIIFKVFFEFDIASVLFCFVLFWWKGMQDLSFIPCVGSQSPKHWTARKSLVSARDPRIPAWFHNTLTQKRDTAFC